MSELPKGWTVVEIGNIADIVTGKTPPKSEANFYEGGDVPFFKPGDLTVGGVITIAEDRVNERALAIAPELPVGTVLVSCIGILGKSAIVGMTGTCNQQINAILPSGAATPEFVYNWSRTIKDWLEQNSSATTVAIINKGRFSAAPVPLPPLAEQKRIVAKLEALNAKSARARTELARIETLVSRYKQAVLSKAFSGELTAHARKPSGETIQATISDPFTHTQSAPAYWTRHLFSEVCTIVGGSQPPKTTFTYAPQEGYVRLVQIRDYKSDAKATYIPRDLARRFCTSTDIMIGRYGPPIFQILRGIEGAYNVALMKAEPTEAVAQEFLYWYLHHPVLFKYVEIDSKRTAGQDGVNKAHLERWPILLPPLEEQHEIVRRIESAFAKIDRLAKEAKRALELLGRLDEAILAKAFRGELVPQDESDEPAEHLLARIRAEREASQKGKRGRGAKA